MSRPLRAPPLTYTVLCNQGGLGDTLARLPALRYILEAYAHASLHVYVQDGWYDLVRYLLPPGLRLKYSLLSTRPAKLASPWVEFDKDRLSSLALNLTTHAFLTLIDQLPPTAESAWYPQARSIAHEERYIIPPRPYVVFTTDYTAPSRAWPSSASNELADLLRQRGINRVLLGAKGPISVGDKDGAAIHPKLAEGLLVNRFIDLRGHTTLIEALRVMQRAEAVIGLDNGLLHLAHCTSTPVVAGYSTLSPQHRVPGRPVGTTLVIEPTSECRGCQSKGFFDPDHDYRLCKLGTYECLPTLSAERYWTCFKELGVV